MPGLKELRNRIDSVRSTRKITQAMRMVAASKLRRAQEAALAGRPYAAEMEKQIAQLLRRRRSRAIIPELGALLGEQADSAAHLLLVLTSDRGLCGGFNSQLVRAAKRAAAETQTAGRAVRIVCLGRKGDDGLRRDYAPVMEDRLLLSRTLDFADAEAASARILTLLAEGSISSCSLIYSRFVSVISQQAHTQNLIPPELNAEESAHDQDSIGAAIYEYEPDEDEMLLALLRRNLAVQIYRGLSENAAGEQGARMAAMDSATRNADEMINTLSIRYNRTRQAVITKELVEIISGAEAL